MYYVQVMVVATGDGDPFFDAVRLLMLLEAAAVGVDPQRAGSVPSDAVGVVRSQTFLQKLDFWLRYPDYLADELLNDYEKSGEQVLLEIASSILDSEEPELRRQLASTDVVYGVTGISVTGLPEYGVLP